MKVLLLGAGMQGKAALHDLVHSPQVREIVAADVDPGMVQAFVRDRGWDERVRSERVDATDARDLGRVLDPRPDVVIDLLPRTFIATVARACIARGVHLVNTMYVTPELRALDEAARRAGVAILPEFGLDPGLDLVMLADAARQLDSIDEIHSYGAGIPELVAADNAIRYKVSWTFEGVLNAYRRSARAIRGGAVVDIGRRDIFAPNWVHEVDVAGLGTLEAFPNGNAVDYAADLGIDVRALQSAGRYTMRWPGHCEFWKKIVDLHLLDDEPVMVGGTPVDRVRYLAAALGPHLQYAPGERDVAVVRVDVIGRTGDARRRIRHELVDRLDLTTGLSAMSRTVGFTASIGAQLLASGSLGGPGLLSPLRDVPYAQIRDQLARRGVHLVREECDA